MSQRYRINPFTGLLDLCGSVEIVTLDVDTGTTVVDSFLDTAGRAVVWNYVIDKGSGSNMRSGRIQACWDKAADSSPVNTPDESTGDIGDTSGVSFSVDKSTNTVNLKCTVTSDDWLVSVERTLIG